MLDKILPFLIVCPLVGIAGYVDAIAGGGGLISLPAYLLAGLPVHTAIGTNKLSSAAGTTLTTVRFAKQGYIDVKFAIPCAVFSLMGSYLGANLALFVNERTFKLIMLVVLPLVAAYVISGRALKERDESDKFPLPKAMAVAVSCALFIGLYDGFYGPGTGTFLLLLLTGMARMSLNSAAGITKVINLSSNIASLALYSSKGNVIFPLGIAAAVFGLLGNYLGTKTFTAKGSRGAKPIIIAVLTIFFVKTVIELLQG